MSSRKKVTRLSKSERTESILAAAREVFEARGYELAKVSDIATNIGIVESTVFHYFGSKRSLMLKVIERFYEDITEEITEGIKGVQGTRNQLHYLIRYHFNLVNTNAALCGVILRESRGLNPSLSPSLTPSLNQDIRRFNRNYTNVLNDVTRAGIANREILASCNPASLRKTLYGHIEHTLWDHLSEGTDIDVDASAEELTNLIFTGIAIQPACHTQSETKALIVKLNRLLD